MGRLFLITLEGNIYSCKHCHTHLGLADHIISKTFQCRHGRAYLFDRVVNVTLGEKEERMMLTGMHSVVDIFCVGCGSIVGWKYEAAQEKSQKYKEGKFILESFNQIFAQMHTELFWFFLPSRFKILSPDGSSYSIIQDAQLGGSDTDEP
ncbi:protein yippee-like isoform X2 [Capsicum annuum]|uniref:protein yippee-like isoform X2 n=1 Tax=Capsicum annuum TaxID=4072 RepID=UPI001FB086CA|nr:protein yippee-like isoform X2 [Capsicum annuum]